MLCPIKTPMYFSLLALWNCGLFLQTTHCAVVYNPLTSHPQHVVYRRSCYCVYWLTSQGLFLISIVGIHIPTFWLFMKLSFTITLWEAIILLFSNFRLKTSLQRCKMTRQGVCPSEQSRAFSPKSPVLSQVIILTRFWWQQRKATEKMCTLDFDQDWGAVVSKNLWIVKMIPSTCSFKLSSGPGF